MTDDRDQDRERDEQRRIEQEIRARRRGDLAGAIAGQDGGQHLRGASPTPVIRRATLEVEQWLADNLDDAGRTLARVIVRRLVARPDLLEAGLDHPAATVAAWLEPLLAVPAAVDDLVREVDMLWGQEQDERPYFEREGRPADPDDPYTIAGVTATLTGLLTTARDQS